VCWIEHSRVGFRNLFTHNLIWCTKESTQVEELDPILILLLTRFVANKLSFSPINVLLDVVFI
jgi:hypothetical protein